LYKFAKNKFVLPYMCTYFWPQSSKR